VEKEKALKNTARKLEHFVMVLNARIAIEFNLNGSP
jgi:hypothetical protein